jgi:hypothetical protein
MFLSRLYGVDFLFGKLSRFGMKYPLVQKV